MPDAFPERLESVMVLAHNVFESSNQSLLRLSSKLLRLGCVGVEDASYYIHRRTPIR